MTPREIDTWLAIAAVFVFVMAYAWVDSLTRPKFKRTRRHGPRARVRVRR